MKKTFILLAVIGLFQIATAQKYFTRSGKIVFEASVPSFEEVKATSSSATTILNSDNGEVAVLILLKSFRFKVALMEEHFNENYVESDKYPKATFKGKIKDFNLNSLTNTFHAYVVEGKLSIRGKTKDIRTEAKLKKENTGLLIIGDFIVNPEDFDIKIPKIVRKKIANEVKISYDMLINPKDE